MQEISSDKLKSIMLSRRANMYYLERCRVQVNGGRVEYLSDAGRQALFWNIPIANTTTILLGQGTSITQAAMRELAKAGVLVGFCGSGGTPLFSANEVDVEVSWMSPQSEYRPTQYLQGWIRSWLEEQWRLDAAKQLQRWRLEQIQKHWQKLKADDEFYFSANELEAFLSEFRERMNGATDVQNLLLEEARLAKALYRKIARATAYGDFVRAKRGGGTDPANRFLDHGNYLAYGLGATATWVLGLPHGLAVLHGKTRRGALVFDTADLIKDAFILPQAFLSAMEGHDEQQFRARCIEKLTREQALDFMIESLKELALSSTNAEASS